MPVDSVALRHADRLTHPADHGSTPPAGRGSGKSNGEEGDDPLPPRAARRYFLWQLKQRSLLVSATHRNFEPVFFVLWTSWQEVHSTLPPQSRSLMVSP